MLAEAKREAERIVKEANDEQLRLVSEQEVVKQAENHAEDIVEEARAREREIRLGAEDYADDILNTLNQHIVQIMQSTDMKQRLNDDGLVPVGNTRQQFAAHIKSELTKWADVIKRLGTRID